MAAAAEAAGSGMPCWMFSWNRPISISLTLLEEDMVAGGKLVLQNFSKDHLVRKETWVGFYQ